MLVQIEPEDYEYSSPAKEQLLIPSQPGRRHLGLFEDLVRQVRNQPILVLSDDCY